MSNKQKRFPDDNKEWTEQDIAYAANIILKVFRTYDVDDGGTLQRRELRHFLHRCGASLSPQQCDTIIRQIDVDGDGEMNFAEFMAFLGRLYQLQFYGTDSKSSPLLGRLSAGSRPHPSSGVNAPPLPPRSYTSKKSFPSSNNSFQRR